MQINLIWDLSVSSAPADFKTDVEQAAAVLESTFFSPITVNITVGWDEIGGQPITDPNIAEGFAELSQYSYTQLVSALAAHSVSPAGEAAVATLAGGSSLQGQSSFSVATAEAKALGLMDANDPATDGAIGFGTGWTDDSTIIAGALHELTHAMGRDAGFAPFDFYRFSSPGVRVFGDAVPAPAAYFSLDGGITSSVAFDTSSDPGDFVDDPFFDDPFTQEVGPSGAAFTPADIEMMDVLGFDSEATWVGPSPASPSGNYSTASNWSTGIVPNPNNAIIDAADAVVTVNTPAAFLSLVIGNASAELDIPQDGSVVIGESPKTPDLVSVNDGRIKVEVVGSLTIEEDLDNSGSIVVVGNMYLGDGEITGAGSLKIRGLLQAQGKISDGTVKIVQGGSIVFDPGTSVLNPASLIDNGTIVVESGATEGPAKLKLKAGAISGSGGIQLQQGTLVVKGALALPVNFENQPATLVLDQSQSFTGVISDLNQGAASEFDLRDVAFVGSNEATFVSGSNGGTLTVSDGTHVANLQLAGDIQPSGFVAASDGQGGTLVTYNPTTPAAHVLFAQSTAGLPDRTGLETERPPIASSPRSDLAALAVAWR